VCYPTPTAAYFPSLVRSRNCWRVGAGSSSPFMGSGSRPEGHSEHALKPMSDVPA